MWNLAKRIYKLLNKREKWLAAAVIMLFVVASLTEVAGLGLIFLYVKLILEPEALQAMPWLLEVKAFIGSVDHRMFMMQLGVFLLALLVVKTFFGVVAVWATMRFAMGRMAAFSSDIFRIYLFKHYTYFLENHTAALKKNILEEMFITIFYVLIPVLALISEIIVLTFIVLLLLAIYPVQTALMFAITAALFGIYILLARGWIDRLSIEKEVMNQQRHRLIQDAFTAIKETILWGKRVPFSLRLDAVMWRYAYTMTWHQVVIQVPRFFIEAIGLFMVVALILYYLYTSDNPAQVISMIALYGAAGMRMLPSFNRIVINLGQARFNKRAFLGFYGDLKLRRFLPSQQQAMQQDTNTTPLPFEKALAVEAMTFAYREGAKPALQDVSLVIPKNSTVAFVGASGAGKSTMVELLLGLIEPTQGTISVDGVPLCAENISRWRAAIGYIPQRVFLLDTSVAENVAFGELPEHIDMERVRWACRIARIDSFITQDLVEGYQTHVGEHGARLSGGQVQRIAIARALYRQPAVLVMDEATAALDNITEREITETLDALSGKMTVIIIAHRLNTIRRCDRIFFLQQGKITDSGTYAELLQRNTVFQKMVGEQ